MCSFARRHQLVESKHPGLAGSAPLQKVMNVRYETANNTKRDEVAYFVVEASVARTEEGAGAGATQTGSRCALATCTLAALGTVKERSNLA